MGQKEKGLYNKFDISRTDGQSDVGNKHFGCEYFVLDLTHDEHAIPALEAYAKSAMSGGYKLLAKDLMKRVSSMKAAQKVQKDSHR